MTSRDDLIYAFLGDHEHPTALGHEILACSNEEVSNRIAQVFQSPSSNVAALEIAMEQSGISPIQFAAAQQALITRILEWRQAYLNARQDYPVTSASASPSKTQSLSLDMACTPPQGVLQRDVALIQLLADQLTASTTVSGMSSSLEGSEVRPSYNSKHLLPEDTKAQHPSELGNDMPAFLRSLAIVQENSHAVEQSWRRRSESPKAMSNALPDSQTPCVVRTNAQKHTDCRTHIQQRGPRQKNCGLALNDMRFTKHYVGTCCNAASTTQPLSAYTETLGELGDYPSQSSTNPACPPAPEISDSLPFHEKVVFRPNVNGGSQYLLSDKLPESYDVASPFQVPPVPQNSPIVYSADYYSRNCLGYTSPLDMLHEVSRNLRAPLGDSWESPSTPNPKMSSKPLEKLNESSSITDHPSPWTHTPGRLTVTSSIGESSSGYSSQAQTSRKLGSRKDTADLLSSNYRLTTLQPTKQNFRTSLDSVDTRASSWATWSTAPIEEEHHHPWKFLLKTPLDAQAYMMQYVKKKSASEDNSEAAVLEAYAFLGLNPETVFSTHQVTRASEALLAHISGTWWNNVIPGQQICEPPQDVKEDTPSTTNHQLFHVLPGFYKAVQDATNLCLQDVEKRFVARFGQRDENEDAAIVLLNEMDPCSVLNLGSRHDLLIHHMAAMTDLAVFRCAPVLGSERYVKAVREKIYRSLLGLLDEQPVATNSF